MKNGIPAIQREGTQAAHRCRRKRFYPRRTRAYEYQIANIGGHLIPLSDLTQRVDELDYDREIVVHCKGGVRSATAVELLRQAGFKHISSLAGGILAWANKVDPKIPKY